MGKERLCVGWWKCTIKALTLMTKLVFAKPYLSAHTLLFPHQLGILYIHCGADGTNMNQIFFDIVSKTCAGNST